MQAHASSRSPAATLWFLVATAFLGAMGIGLVGPVVPFLAERFAPGGDLAFIVSSLSLSYAAAAFLAAPVLGALSDRYGRRPILIVSVLGSALGYLLFGIAGATWMLVCGRLIDGLTAGNFSAVFAAISDSTAPAERGRSFGLVGAGVGAGFILGPAIGGLLSRFGLSAPLYFAAGLALTNALFGFFFMPETRPADMPRAPWRLTRLNPFAQLRSLLAVDAIRPLLYVSMLFATPFAMMTTLLALLTKDALGWSASQVSVLFVLVGLGDIAVQGFLLGKLLRVLGERRAALGGVALAVLGMAGMAATALFRLPALIYVATVAFAVGEGVFNACLSSLLSQSAGREDQGKVHGGSQGLQSLTQVVGPALGGGLYARFAPSAPFLFGLALLVAAALLLGRSLQRAPALISID